MATGDPSEHGVGGGAQDHDGQGGVGLGEHEVGGVGLDQSGPGPVAPLVDFIGRLVGLMMSALFFLFAAYYLVSGKAAGATQIELQVLYALMIILGGPIPYFFASATNANVSLNTGAGRIWLAGGYAVSLAAVLVVMYVIPGHEVWRVIEFDNLKQKIPTRTINLWQDGGGSDVYRLQSDDSTPCRAWCRFRANVTAIGLTIRFLHPTNPVIGVAEIHKQVSRAGKEVEYISLSDEDSSGQGSNSK
jgi:hypothetical protein